MTYNVYECDACGSVWYTSFRSSQCSDCGNEAVALVSEVGDE